MAICDVSTVFIILHRFLSIQYFVHLVIHEHATACDSCLVCTSAVLQYAFRVRELICANASVCFCETAGFKKQHWLISGCVISSFSAHNSHLNYNEQVNLCSCACPKLVQLKSRVTRLGSFWFQAEVQHRKTSYHQIFFNFFFLFGGGVLYTAHSAIIFFNLWLYFVLWSFLLLLLLFFNWAILSFQILTSCPCVFSFSVITCDTLICITWILVTGVPSYSELSQLPDFFFGIIKSVIFFCVFLSRIWICLPH